MRRETRPASGARQSAFTLIEMLVVIAIMIILFALLVPAVSLVRGVARRSVAKTEATHIAAAWEHYYSQYQRWPSFVTSGDPVPIEGTTAQLLCPPPGGTISPDNPRRLAFLTFNRINTNGLARFCPVSPWGGLDTPILDDWKYYAIFDADFDNVIPATAASLADRSWDRPNATSVHASVIVWTVNPDVEASNTRYIIGSWDE